MISIALLFSFEFFENWSDEVVIARAEHKAKKEISDNFLKQLKLQAKSSVIGEQYFEAKKDTDKAWDQLTETKQDTKIFGFTWWQQFFGEFGPWCAFFLFASFHLIRSFVKEPNNQGLILFNLSFVVATIFFLTWVFGPKQDFPKIAYYLITVLCSSIIYLGVWLLSKNYHGKLAKWKKKFIEMAKFSFVHTKEESRKKMLDKIEDLSSQ